jgi:hypothetical protein
MAIATDEGRERLPRHGLRRREDHGLDAHHVFPPAQRRGNISELAIETGFWFGAPSHGLEPIEPERRASRKLAHAAECDQAIEQPPQPAVAHGAAARRRQHGVFVEEGFDDRPSPPRPQPRSDRDELLRAAPKLSAWSEGGDRYRDLFSKHPPALIAQFAERVPMVKGRWITQFRHRGTNTPRGSGGRRRPRLHDLAQASPKESPMKSDAAEAIPICQERIKTYPKRFILRFRKAERAGGVLS